jgi:hypothetical protein
MMLQVGAGGTTAPMINLQKATNQRGAGAWGYDF